jgi:type II secretory pathway pseudopilin PulG
MVETAVTLAVIGLLAAIAFPTLRGLLPRVRLGNNTGILVNEIALARRQAIAQSVDYSIVFDTASESYTLWKGAVGGGTRLGTNTVAGSDIVSVTGFAAADAVVALAGGGMNVPPAVALLDPDGNPLFDSDGNPIYVQNKGYITLGTPDGSRTKRIQVETLGRVVVER